MRGIHGGGLDVAEEVHRRILPHSQARTPLRIRAMTGISSYGCHKKSTAPVESRTTHRYVEPSMATAAALAIGSNPLVAGRFR